MARDFDGTADRIDWSNMSDLAGGPITVSLWAYFDTLDSSEYMFHIAVSGDNIGLQFSHLYTTGVGVVNFTRKGTTNNSRWSATGTLTTGSWVHLLATNDGTINDYTTNHIYKNGTEVTYLGGSSGSGTELPLVGKWSAGGRFLDDARNLDGKIAFIGVWSRVLNSTEISGLAAGNSPQFYPTDLEFYAVNGSVYKDYVTGESGTLDGTSVTDDPAQTHPISKSESVTVTDTPTMSGSNIVGSESVTVTDTPAVAVSTNVSVFESIITDEGMFVGGEGLGTLSISITPDTVFAPGIRIY